jgi:hypothetical protein
LSVRLVSCSCCSGRPHGVSCGVRMHICIRLRLALRPFDPVHRVCSTGCSVAAASVDALLAPPEFAKSDCRGFLLLTHLHMYAFGTHTPLRIQTSTQQLCLLSRVLPFLCDWCASPLLQRVIAGGFLQLPNTYMYAFGTHTALAPRCSSHVCSALLVPLSARAALAHFTMR